MSRTMAQSLTPHRIRVNVIAAGRGNPGLQELSGPYCCSPAVPVPVPVPVPMPVSPERCSISIGE
jgi:NAD(P)-dependent dehydrogenase (short-subunit alcohol dehydrogenase family)